MVIGGGQPARFNAFGFLKGKNRFGDNRSIKIVSGFSVNRAFKSPAATIFWSNFEFKASPFSFE
jgi:hypothetical protein